MKAARLYENGGPEMIRFEEVPDPQPGPGEVLIRIRAAGVNHRDLRNRRERDLPFPYILGCDIAGEIEIAPEESPLRPGQPVVLFPLESCGLCRHCQVGCPNNCAQAKIIDGGYAEFVTAPVERVVPLPAGIPWEIAACLPVAYTTAWHMLIERAALQPGETVLVLGVSSGLGSAAVQIARTIASRVLGTVGSADKVERALALGVDYVVNHHKPDFASEILEYTANQGVDVVVEHIGAATWRESIRALSRGGRLVTSGATTGIDGVIEIRELFRRMLTIMGSFLGTKSDLERVVQRTVSGDLQPVVDRVLPLDQAAEAHRILEMRRHFGKIVLVP